MSRITISTLEIFNYIRHGIDEIDKLNRTVIVAVALGDLITLKNMATSAYRGNLSINSKSILTFFLKDNLTIEDYNRQCDIDFMNPAMVYLRGIKLFEFGGDPTPISDFIAAESMGFPLINQLYVWICRCFSKWPWLKASNRALYEKINRYAPESKDYILMYNLHRNYINNSFKHINTNMNKEQKLTYYMNRDAYESALIKPEYPYNYYHFFLNTKRQILEDNPNNFLILIINYYLTDIEHLAFVYHGHNYFEKEKYLNKTPGGGIYTWDFLTEIISFANQTRDKDLIRRIVKVDLPMYINIDKLPPFELYKHFYDAFLHSLVLIEDFNHATSIARQLGIEYVNFISSIAINSTKVYPSHILSYKKKLLKYIYYSSSLFKIMNNHDKLILGRDPPTPEDVPQLPELSRIMRGPPPGFGDY